MLAVDRALIVGAEGLVAELTQPFEPFVGTHAPPQVVSAQRVWLYDSRKREMDTPYAIEIRAEVTSTQDVARELLTAAPEQPVLVVAERQTAGRGRTGNSWETAPRALAATLAFYTRWRREDLPLIPLVAGLTARAAVRDRTGVLAALKWPNDIVTDAGKLGGLLVEASGALVAVGCGINLWWPQPPAGVAGAVPADPGPDLAAEIAADWASRLVPSLVEAEAEWDRDEYLAACSTLGQHISWEPNGTGVAIDIDPMGGLVVDTGSGRLTLRSGSVASVRDATLAGDSAIEGRPS